MNAFSHLGIEVSRSPAFIFMVRTAESKTYIFTLDKNTIRQALNCQHAAMENLRLSKPSCVGSSAMGPRKVPNEKLRAEMASKLPGM